MDTVSRSRLWDIKVVSVLIVVTVMALLCKKSLDPNCLYRNTWGQVLKPQVGGQGLNISS